LLKYVDYDGVECCAVLKNKNVLQIEKLHYL